MARKAKADHTPEQPSRDKPERLSAADWAPLSEAFERAKTALVSSDLAMRDLLDDLRSGRLPSAVRIIARDGTETSGRQKASFWQKVTLRRWLDGVAVSFIDPGHVEPGSVWHLVARRELDRLYPAKGFAPVDDATDDSDAAPRVRPGTKPRGNWPEVLARFLIAVTADDKRRLQNADALVIDAQKFLHNHIGWAPSDPKVLRAKIVELLQDVRF